jgi:hypothetical protein
MAQCGSTMMRVGVLEHASLHQTLPSKPDPTRRQQQRSHVVQSTLSQAHKLPAQFTAFDEESNIMPFGGQTLLVKRRK